MDFKNKNVKKYLKLSRYSFFLKFYEKIPLISIKQKQVSNKWIPVKI
jgi:hypothetical protein